MRHLLVTNDFPPKVGGIQSYLWELWRRLPADEVTVLTSPHPAAAEWDREQAFRIERVVEPVLLPHPGLARRVRHLADEVGAELIVIDPVLPLGAMGRFLNRPYALILHGAEITMPGRLPLASQAMASVLRNARLVIAAGGYPLAEAERAAGRPLPSVVVPPGVDVDRFRPLDPAGRRAAREEFGLPVDATIVTSVSRLVPRKGMDVLIEAVAALSAARPDLHLAIAGEGRDRSRLDALAARTGAPVSFVGRLADAALPEFYGCGDVFAMLCRDRWFGLEQEGFGIVFLEAAAAGVPQVAGRSGGSHEAVEHATSGLVVDRPGSAREVAEALAELLDRPDERRRMAVAGRSRAEREFSYDMLAGRLATALDQVEVGGAVSTDKPAKPRAQTAAEARAEVEALVAANRQAREAAMHAHFGTTVPGARMIAADLVVTAAFAVLAVVGAIVGGSAADLAGNASLIVAAAGTLVFLLALWDGAQRSRRSVLGIGGWFFLAASAPRRVQYALLGSLAVQTVVGISTAWATFDIGAAVPTPLAFGTLVPVFGLAVCGVWGARHGYFPPRPEEHPT